MSIKACVLQIYSFDAFLKNKFSTFKVPNLLVFYNERFKILLFK